MGSDADTTAPAFFRRAPSAFAHRQRALEPLGPLGAPTPASRHDASGTGGEPASTSPRRRPRAHALPPSVKTFRRCNLATLRLLCPVQQATANPELYRAIHRAQNDIGRCPRTGGKDRPALQQVSTRPHAGPVPTRRSALDALTSSHPSSCWSRCRVHHIGRPLANSRAWATFVSRA